MVDPMIDALINNVNALIDDDSLDTEVYADASWAEVQIIETGLGNQATPTITYSGVSNVEREKANAILVYVSLI